MEKSISSNCPTACGTGFEDSATPCGRIAKHWQYLQFCCMKEVALHYRPSCVSLHAMLNHCVFCFFMVLLKIHCKDTHFIVYKRHKQYVNIVYKRQNRLDNKHRRDGQYKFVHRAGVLSSKVLMFYFSGSFTPPASACINAFDVLASFVSITFWT